MTAVHGNEVPLVRQDSRAFLFSTLQSGFDTDVQGGFRPWTFFFAQPPVPWTREGPTKSTGQGEGEMSSLYQQQRYFWTGMCLLLLLMPVIFAPAVLAQEPAPAAAPEAAPAAAQEPAPAADRVINSFRRY